MPQLRNRFLLFILIGVLLLSIAPRFLYIPQDMTIKKDRKRQLEEDGYVRLDGLLTRVKVQALQQQAIAGTYATIKRAIQTDPDILVTISDLLGPDYVFQDYVFVIKKSQFHTCHRDYNGDFFNPEQKHPSYTIILYIDPMPKCLDVIPSSHLDRAAYQFNITDHTQTLTCIPGDVILFNANLIHSGSLNQDENHLRIQMKLSHRDDLEVLRFYTNYNKVLNQENPSPYWVKATQKHISCQFPVISAYLKDYDQNATASSSASLFSGLFAELEDVLPEII